MFFVGSDRSANQNAVSTFMPCLRSQLTFIVNALVACLKYPELKSENSLDGSMSSSMVSSIHKKPLNRLESKELNDLITRHFGPT